MSLKVNIHNLTVAISIGIYPRIWNLTNDKIEKHSKTVNLPLFYYPKIDYYVYDFKEVYLK